ncbi:flagellar basal body-associated protein FliL [Kushneria aurantia]|uniref:Flagellar protein FliL n=1 Tax=Kushneria aurantia TaxID=504092 RepID=A0ABV6G0X0_9GAMM|nr:flagellar basal body-associated protein FliL [Kushneria aurantia]
MTSQAAVEAKSGNKKLLWIIIALLVLLLAAAGVAGWFFFHGGNAAHDEAGTAATQDAAPATPVFVELQPFTINLAGASDRILYIGITLTAASEEDAAILREQTPEVRNRILMVLTGQSAEALTTQQGKEALAQELVNAFDSPLGGDDRAPVINNALFTDFIVQ